MIKHTWGFTSEEMNTCLIFEHIANNGHCTGMVNKDHQGNVEVFTEICSFDKNSLDAGLPPWSGEEAGIKGKIVEGKFIVESLNCFKQDFRNRNIRTGLLLLGLALKEFGVSVDMGFLNLSSQYHLISYSKPLLKKFDDLTYQSLISQALLSLEVSEWNVSGKEKENFGCYAYSIRRNFESFNGTSVVYKYNCNAVKPLEGEELDYLKLWDLYFGIELSYAYFNKDMIKTDEKLYSSWAKTLADETDHELLSLIKE